MLELLMAQYSVPGALDRSLVLPLHWLVNSQSKL
jgi:hypothetical protein